MDTNAPQILYCNCSHSAVVPADVKRTVLAALSASGAAVVTVADLCGMAAQRDPTLGRFAAAADLTIIACHPRAVRWLFHAAGAPLPGRGIGFLNMRTQTAAEIIACLPKTPGTGKALPELAPEKDEWIPWFPVIDYSRCRNCKQCLSFCLFGVYEKGQDSNVVVANPRNCKTNCPACARICPEVAIMFPKYADAPINGAEITDETMERAKVKVNMEKVLGNDVYATLAKRRKHAGKSILKRRDSDKVTGERREDVGRSLSAI